MKPKTSKPVSTLLFALGHVVNDMSGNTLSGLLPILASMLGLSYTLAGVVVMVLNVTSSIIQPLFGRWFDRTQAIWLAEVGLTVNCICISLIGMSPNYWVLLFLVAMAGLGAAAFHPPAFSAIVRSAASSKGGVMSIFTSCGNVGFFLGPVLVGILVSAFGLHGMLLLLPIGVFVAVFIFRFQPKTTKILSTKKEEGYINKRLLGLLMGITGFRSIAISTAMTFLPLYFVTRGDSLLLATSVASMWLAAGVIGQLGGGFLSDRVGKRPVIAVSLVVGAITFYGFLVTTGFFSMVLLIISGALLFASWSVIFVMSSEAAPGSVGTVTGLMLGFSVGIGGFGVLGFGGAADQVGLAATFNIVIASAIAGGLLALFLPSDRKNHFRS